MYRKLAVAFLISAIATTLVTGVHAATLTSNVSTCKSTQNSVSVKFYNGLASTSCTSVNTDKSLSFGSVIKTITVRVNRLETGFCKVYVRRAKSTYLSLSAILAPGRSDVSSFATSRLIYGYKLDC